jgi:hypothetical protein
MVYLQTTNAMYLLSTRYLVLALKITIVQLAVPAHKYVKQQYLQQMKASKHTQQM